MVVSDQFVLCKAALVFTITRWLLSLALNLLNTSPQPSSCCSANLKMLRQRLSLTTVPEGQHETCAICLSRMTRSSQVWELSNCCHVFHKHCLEGWLAYDSKMTCPLCRASLIGNRPVPLPEQPSWAVERMLYLFGDDLLP